MGKMGEFISSKYKAVLLISIFISVLVTAAITRNEINDDFLKYFDEDITFRADTDWISQNLTGLNQIQFDMQSKKPNGISDPVFLNKLETFANWARNHEVVTNVQSITDVFKRLNRDLNGGDLEFYRIPENRELSRSIFSYMNYHFHLVWISIIKLILISHQLKSLLQLTI